MRPHFNASPTAAVLPAHLASMDFERFEYLRSPVMVVALDAGAFSADRLAAVVHSGQEAVMSAARTGAPGAHGCGETDPANCALGPVGSELAGEAAAAIAGEIS